MAGVVEMDELGFDETELRLCLPGGEVGRGTAKRVFMAERIDLKLNLHTPDSKDDDVEVATSVDKLKRPANLRPCTNDPEDQSPASKAQVVGWPPVRSFRKNIMTVHSEKGRKEDGEKSKNGMTAGYVKVSMDGAPYLRKVDLKVYKSYQELSLAMENMFSSFTVGKCGSQGMNGKDLKNESKLMGLLNGSEYVPTYEDKDGDWMLVGDVPWQMFVESCKRLRIMKGSEAIGLAPRAMEKCKSKI